MIVSPLGPVTIAYETYGRLNEERTNAILIVHALSGSAHAAGFHSTEDAKPGWWDACVGPGKAFDWPWPFYYPPAGVLPALPFSWVDLATARIAYAFALAWSTVRLGVLDGRAEGRYRRWIRAHGDGRGSRRLLLLTLPAGR